MASQVELDLFDYVDEYAAAIRNGQYERTKQLDFEWKIFAFCQLFFDQFFAEFGVNISGFTRASREDAAELVEKLRGENPDSPEARALIALYEEFCDISDDSQFGYGSEPKVDLLSFHNDYLTELLAAALSWASAIPRLALEARIQAAIDGYNLAIEETQWLTR